MLVESIDQIEQLHSHLLYTASKEIQVDIVVKIKSTVRSKKIPGH